MPQLEKLQKLLPEVQESESDVLEIYLDFAKDIICEIRNTTNVEPEFLNLQLKMAVELYSKRGGEGQESHSENGVSRSYGRSEISQGLLDQITPFVKTPYSKKRVIE